MISIKCKCSYNQCTDTVFAKLIQSEFSRSGKEEVLAHLIVLLGDEFSDIFEKKEQVWHFDFSLVDLTFCSKILGSGLA